MPTLLQPTKKFKHIIRPDGSIRVVTKGQIQKEDDEICIELTQRKAPAHHKYDTGTSQIVEFSGAEKSARQASATVSAAEDAATRARKIVSLKTALASESATTRALFEKLGDLVGIDLT